jgi:hypothetical protein
VSYRHCTRSDRPEEIVLEPQQTGDLVERRHERVSLPQLRLPREYGPDLDRSHARSRPVVMVSLPDETPARMRALVDADRQLLQDVYAPCHRSPDAAGSWPHHCGFPS